MPERQQITRKHRGSMGVEEMPAEHPEQIVRLAAQHRTVQRPPWNDRVLSASRNRLPTSWAT